MNSQHLINARDTLKKATPVPPRPANTLTASSIPEEEEYHKLVTDVNAEKWVDLLADQTFESFVFPLSVEHCEALVASHDQHLQTNDVIISDKLEKLRVELQTFLNHHLSPGEGFFAKLSSRSAKDAPVHSENTKQLYKKCLKSALDRDRSIRDHSDKLLNQQTGALLEAATLALQMKTAEETLKLFVKSERIWEDLIWALDHRNQWAESIVIRKWVDIDVDMEFRAFVYNKEICGISQYNYKFYSPRLLAMQTEIKERLVNYFNTIVKPLLDDTYSNYVIDFALTGDSYDHVYVIELNPYVSSTHSGLFCWTTDEELLKRGPLECRFQNKIDVSFSDFPFSWRSVILSCPIDEL